MIPRLEALLDAYYFVARRNGELARYVRWHVVAALDEAAALSRGYEADEPPHFSTPSRDAIRRSLRRCGACPWSSSRLGRRTRSGSH